jgi:predicted transcriptional regulator
MDRRDQKKTRKEAEPTPDMLAKVLAGSMRRRILRLMVLERPGAPLSPSQVAAALGAPMGTVAYHFRVLFQYKTLHLVEEKHVRGAVAHFYLPTDAVCSSGWVRTLLKETDGT